MARTAYLLYCQNQGMPGIVGKTKASYLGEQWNAFNTALGELLAGNTILMGEGDEVDKLDLSATGQLPFPALIQEQNERMATLWRGGSLGTVGTSTGPEQRGVVLQADEEGKLAADDGQRISDTLNQTIDKLVIEWTFGEGVKPLAYVKIAPPATIDVDRDIKTFEFLASKGVELGKQQLREHFSVSEPGDGDELVNPSQPEPEFGPDGEPIAPDEATPEEVKAELEAQAKLAGNEKATRADLLKLLNTPRNARTLNALLRSGEFANGGPGSGSWEGPGDPRFAHESSQKEPILEQEDELAKYRGEIWISAESGKYIGVGDVVESVRDADYVPDGTKGEVVDIGVGGGGAGIGAFPVVKWENGRSFRYGPDSLRHVKLVKPWTKTRR
jgi:hypothetical protein